MEIKPTTQSTVFLLLLFIVYHTAPTRGAPLNNTKLAEDTTTPTSSEGLTTQSESQDENMDDSDDQQTLESYAQDTKNAALLVGQAAKNLSIFITTNFLLESPSSESLCFIDEREPQEIDGQLRPGENYAARILSDQHSLTNFHSYMRNVTAFFNASINKNPTCDYCVQFSDLKQSTAVLMEHFQNLILGIQSSGLLTISQEPQPDVVPEDHCLDVCWEPQSRIYDHYWIFASYYIAHDIEGLLDQAKNSKKG